MPGCLPAFLPALLPSCLLCLQEQAGKQDAGYEPELLQEAGKPGLEAIRNLMKTLPPHDWVQGQVRQTPLLHVVHAPSAQQRWTGRWLAHSC